MDKFCVGTCQHRKFTNITVARWNWINNLQHWLFLGFQLAHHLPDKRGGNISAIFMSMVVKILTRDIWGIQEILEKIIEHI